MQFGYVALLVFLSWLAGFFTVSIYDKIVFRLSRFFEDKYVLAVAEKPGGEYVDVGVVFDVVQLLETEERGSDEATAERYATSLPLLLAVGMVRWDMAAASKLTKLTQSPTVCNWPGQDSLQVRLTHQRAIFRSFVGRLLGYGGEIEPVSVRTYYNAVLMRAATRRGNSKHRAVQFTLSGVSYYVPLLFRVEGQIIEDAEFGADVVYHSG